MEERRVAVRVAYNGKEFHGSQWQPDLKTVEGEILNALKKIEGQDSKWYRLKSSSRTDSGVSAVSNVMAFYTSIKNSDGLLRALNANSKDVYFWACSDIPEDRNVRHALYRRYRYILPSEGLDVDALKKGASLFIGTHDFRHFCKKDGRGTVATVTDIDVHDENEFLIIDLTAPYFLWNMARRIVAAMEQVARGKAEQSEILSALKGKAAYFGVADPHGLILMDVSYHDLIFRKFDDPVLHRKAAVKRFEKRTEEEILQAIWQ